MRYLVSGESLQHRKVENSREHFGNRLVIYFASYCRFHFSFFSTIETYFFSRTEAAGVSRAVKAMRHRKGTKKIDSRYLYLEFIPATSGEEGGGGYKHVVFVTAQQSRYYHFIR